MQKMVDLSPDGYYKTWVAKIIQLSDWFLLKNLHVNFILISTEQESHLLVGL
jgi:hypothetical protein